jgi:RimJ/RimL family protein N-acetyltransferase
MKHIALVSIYDVGGAELQMYARVLYQLLMERRPEENISHKSMPAFDKHIEFIESKPYPHWYIIQSMDEKGLPIIGAIYINHDDSIGIGILDLYKRQHYASAALEALLETHPKDVYYANINPDNYKSKEFFKRHGFKFWRTLKGYVKSDDDRIIYGNIQDTFRLIKETE